MLATGFPPIWATGVANSNTAPGSRDAMSAVGPAMRQAIARASAAELSDGEHRTLNAVFALVTTYSRLTDWVYVADVMKATRLSERQARRNLNSLAGERRIIVWEPRRGHGTRSLLGLPAEGKSGHLGRPLSVVDGKQDTQGVRFQPPQRNKPVISAQQTGHISESKAVTLDDRRPVRNHSKKPQIEIFKPSAALGERGECWTASYRTLIEVSDHSKPGQNAKALRTIFGYWREAERDERELPAEIRRLAALYRLRMPGAILTPTALAKWWHDVERLPQRKYDPTAREIATMYDHETA